MNRIFLIAILPFAFAAQSQNLSPNQELSQTKSLTLKEAITYALENKADAKKAKLKVENSEYQIQEVRS